MTEGCIDLTTGPVSPIVLDLNITPIELVAEPEPVQLVAESSPIELVAEPQPIVLEVGVGVQGPQGVSAGPAFTFPQSTPSAAWVVYHNLGRKPSITIIRSDNVVTFGQISYPNNQSALVQFGRAISGTALVTEEFAMAIPFDSDIDMQSNAIHNVAFDAASIAFASLATPAASFAMGGQKFTNHGSASARTDVPNYGQLLDLVNGTPWATAPVLCVFTTNITLSGEQTTDGVTTSASRVLVAGQSTASENGLYVTAAGAWTRAVDLPVGKDAASFSMWIEEGTTYADTAWRCTSDSGSAVVGTNNLTFSQFASGVSYSADESTLHLSGTTFSVKNGGITSTQLAANAVTTSAITDANVTTAKIADLNVTTGKIADGAVTDAKLASTFCKKYAATIGDGSTTSIVVTHNLGTRDVTVETYTNSGNYDTRNVVVQRTSTNAITLVYGTAPALNSIRVVVIG